MNTYLSLNGKQWDGDTDGCGDSKCNQHTLYLVVTSHNHSIHNSCWWCWMVRWEINVPFQHQNRLYRKQGLGRRFRSARLRMANDTVTSRPHCHFVQWWPNMGKDRGGSFKVFQYLLQQGRYYPTTTRPIRQLNILLCVIAVLQFILISSQWLLLCNLFCVGMAFECFSSEKQKQKHVGDLDPWYQTCPFTPHHLFLNDLVTLLCLSVCGADQMHSDCLYVYTKHSASSHIQ